MNFRSKVASGLTLALTTITLFQSGCTQNRSSTGSLTGAQEPQKSEASKALVMGVSADYPPFEFKKSGEIVGFDVDLAHELAGQLGYSLSVQDMEFSALIPALQTGRVDFVMSSMTITEERKKNIDFSKIYFTSSFSLIVPKASTLNREEDMRGSKIGVQLGSTMEKLAKEKTKVYADMQVHSLPKFEVLIQELKAGRIDGVVSEEAQAWAFVKANPMLRYFTLGSTGDGYSIAFPRGKDQTDPLKAELKVQFETALEKLKTSGKLEEIRTKWLGK